MPPMFTRSLLAAPLLAAALAGPALAAPTPSYDIDIAARLSGTAGGSDGGGWSSASSFSAVVGQSYTGLTGVADGRSDETIEGTASVPPQVSMTRLDQQYALQTAMGTISWSCAPAAEAAGGNGDVSVMRLGDKGSLYGFVIGGKVTQARDCTGFSSFADTIDVSTEPVTVPPTDFSFTDLIKHGTVTVPIDRMVTCGEWTIYQTACTLRLTGEAVIRRTMVDAPESEETVEPEPTPTGYQPAETGDDISSPPRPATPIKAKGASWKHGKGAKVRVECPTACSGKISATAVAKGRQPAKPIGSKPFSSSGGTKTVKIIYGKGGTRTARRRGSVIIDVDASGQTSTFKMRAR